MNELSRREFTKLIAAAGVATRFPQTQTTNRVIGIQVGAVSFVDEGIASVLDRFQRDGNINALFVATFTYGRGIAGRQIPGQPLPDHGAQEYDTSTFHGGSYTAVHSQFFQNSIFQDFRAPDVGVFDLLAEVVPKAKARGMANYCWFEDVYNPQHLAGFEQLARATRSGPGPADGAFVSFWRLLLNYPEILAWEKLWTDSQHEVYGEIFGTVKAIKPRVQVGWHIWHNNSFSPFYRAEQDYWKLRQASDFLKVVMYNNCGGPRLAQYVRNVQSTLFHDAATSSEVLELH